MAKNSEPEAASTYIPEPEKIKLWTRSGGRCAFCNQYLLRDELTTQWLNLAELAHNVGRKKSAGSPRGLDSLPIEQRNKADNLLLLCKDHHTLIDHKVKRAEYSVDDLQQMKKRHESRIEYLTGLGADVETTVVRVVGAIRGSAPDVSAETVRATVLESGRYPRFPLAFDGQDLEIDLRNLPGEGSELYWQVGLQRIDEVLTSRLNEGVGRGRVRHISVFALARIPFLIYFGYRLDDKIPTNLYQKHRSGGEGWSWDDQVQPTQFTYEQIKIGDDIRRVVVALSVSGRVSINELPIGLRENCSTYVLSPEGTLPERDILRSAVSLANFSATFQKLLSELEVSAKGAEIHLFSAVPVTAAVACGRSIMRDAQPPVVVYDRQGSEYIAVLEVNRV